MIDFTQPITLMNGAPCSYICASTIQYGPSIIIRLGPDKIIHVDIDGTIGGVQVIKNIDPLEKNIEEIKKQFREFFEDALTKLDALRIR